MAACRQIDIAMQFAKPRCQTLISATSAWVKNSFAFGHHFGERLSRCIS
jgi:hypothetical protein